MNNFAYRFAVLRHQLQKGANHVYDLFKSSVQKFKEKQNLFLDHYSGIWIYIFHLSRTSGVSST